ncbi:MAG: DNA-binding response regulator [Motiliproteus sp.]
MSFEIITKQSPKMFWVDLRNTKSENNSQALFSAHFLITKERRVSEFCSNLGSLKSDVDICCFEYDYPDLLGLNLLKNTRVLFPQLPILLLTHQHSEALAVWALRLHVWDLRIKPISMAVVRDLAQTVKAFKQPGKGGVGPFNRFSPDCLVPDELRLRSTLADDVRIRPGLLFIKEHFKEKITERQVSEACGLGLFTFSKEFKRLMGVTFQEYLQQQRIIESMRLLMHPRATVTDVAFLSGFGTISYFCKVFKRTVGCTPSVFRNNGDVDILGVCRARGFCSAGFTRETGATII